LLLLHLQVVLSDPLQLLLLVQQRAPQTLTLSVALLMEAEGMMDELQSHDYIRSLIYQTSNCRQTDEA